MRDRLAVQSASPSTRFAAGSKNRLTAHDLGRFAGDTLFDRIGRVVCHVGRLPRKELFEAWEVARRVRRYCRGGRVVDVAGGHGLLAYVMVLLDDSSPHALVVDPAPVASGEALRAAFVAEWPRLEGRVVTMADDIRRVSLHATDLIVSCHACGVLTDHVLDAARTARAAVAVLPCCHDVRECDSGPLAGWLDASMAIDVMRACRLTTDGYHVRTQTIPGSITPKNRLLIAVPAQVSETREREALV